MALTLFAVIALRILHRDLPQFPGLVSKIQIIGSWMPLLAAGLVVGALEERAGVIRLFSKFIRFRVAARWYLVACIPVGWVAVSVAAYHLSGGLLQGGVIVLRVEGLMANRVALALAERGGIGVRSGCHCAHMLVKRILNVPPTLEHFQGVILRVFKQLSLPGLTRISLGLENNAEEIDTVLRVLRQIAAQPNAAGNDVTRRQMNDFVTGTAQRVYALPAATPQQTHRAEPLLENVS